jgi:hypothetical protein
MGNLCWGGRDSFWPVIAPKLGRGRMQEDLHATALETHGRSYLDREKLLSALV